MGQIEAQARKIRLVHHGSFCEPVQEPCFDKPKLSNRLFPLQHLAFIGKKGCPPPLFPLPPLPPYPVLSLSPLPSPPPCYSQRQSAWPPFPEPGLLPLCMCPLPSSLPGKPRGRAGCQRGPSPRLSWQPASWQTHGQRLHPPALLLPLPLRTTQGA